jgi:hypothetical protein
MKKDPVSQTYTLAKIVRFTHDDLRQDEKGKELLEVIQDLALEILYLQNSFIWSVRAYEKEIAILKKRIEFLEPIE